MTINRIQIVFLLISLLTWVETCASTEVVTYYLTDPQGTPLATTDAAGNITARFEITPYGVVKLDAMPTIGLGGHVVDDDTTLVYMQSRYYDPQIGRFLGVDPERVTPGNNYSFNRFNYGLNNPLRYIDPDGADPVEDQKNAPTLPPTIVNAIRLPDLMIAGGPSISLIFTDNRTPGVKSINERKPSFDEFASCINMSRWDWGQMGPAGDGAEDNESLGTAANLANISGNLIAGRTGSGMSSATHFTSWPHRLGSYVGRAVQRSVNGRSFGPYQGKVSAVGKYAGRAFIIPTIWEGFYDLSAEAQCSRMGLD